MNDILDYGDVMNISLKKYDSRFDNAFALWSLRHLLCARMCFVLNL